MSRAQRNRGRELAHALVSTEPERAAMARKALADAPPKVTDAAAKTLCDFIEGGARANATAAALSHPKAPRFGDESHTKILIALTQAGKTDALVKWMQHGADKGYLKKAQNSKPELGTKLMPRVASVATRSWVIVVFGFPLFIGVISMFSEPQLARPIGLSLLVLGVFVVFIDAWVRRCPSCRKFLAGQLLSIVRDGSYTTTSSIQTAGGGTAQVQSTVHTHERTWRCVFCQHRWSK